MLSKKQDSQMTLLRGRSSSHPAKTLQLLIFGYKKTIYYIIMWVPLPDRENKTALVSSHQSCRSTYMVFSSLNGSKTVVVDTRRCRSLPR